MILTYFFYNVSSFLLSHELPQKIIPYFIKEQKVGKMKWFESVTVADMEHRSNCINMPHLALEPTDQYGFSSLNDYKFVSQGILCLLPPKSLYHHHYIQCIRNYW
jgi:hypothetical protein